MKNIGTIAAAVFLAVVLLLYMCTFQVRFTEVAVVKTWGKPADRAIMEPGLKIKWPRPIQSFVRYDKRIRILEDRTEETRTIDGKNLLVTTFTLWRIGGGEDDPVKFLEKFPGGVEEGEAKLRTTVVAHKQATIGKHEFDEFVSVEPEKRKLRQIEREIWDAVAADAGEQYGIEVVGFGIKKLGLPQAVTTAIFASMKAHEEAKAKRYETEGQATARRILADARAAEGRIMAAAREKVAEIEARAEQKVSEYYNEFDEHPELRIFLDTLRTYTRALRQRTTLIIDTETAPWNVFTKQGRAGVRPSAAPDTAAGAPYAEPQEPTTTRESD